MSYPNQPPTIEEGVNALLLKAKRNICEKVDGIEECFREKPGQAVVACLAAGYVLHRLPVRSLVVSQARLIAALAPPMLLAFGAAKLCEFLQGQAWKQAGHPEEGHLVEVPNLVE